MSALNTQLIPFLPFAFGFDSLWVTPTNFKSAELQERVLSVNATVRKGGTQTPRKQCERRKSFPDTLHALLSCLPLPGGLFSTVALFGLQISQTSTFLSTGVEQLHTSCQFLTLQTRTSSERFKKQAKGTRLSHWRLHWESFPPLLIFLS